MIYKVVLFVHMTLAGRECPFSIPQSTLNTLHDPPDIHGFKLAPCAIQS